VERIETAIAERVGANGSVTLKHGKALDIMDIILNDISIIWCSTRLQIARWSITGRYGWTWLTPKSFNSKSSISWTFPSDSKLCTPAAQLKLVVYKLTLTYLWDPFRFHVFLSWVFGNLNYCYWCANALSCKFYIRSLPSSDELIVYETAACELSADRIGIMVPNYKRVSE